MPKTGTSEPGDHLAWTWAYLPFSCKHREGNANVQWGRALSYTAAGLCSKVQPRSVQQPAAHSFSVFQSTTIRGRLAKRGFHYLVLDHWDERLATDLRLPMKDQVWDTCCCVCKINIGDKALSQRPQVNYVYEPMSWGTKGLEHPWVWGKKKNPHIILFTVIQQFGLGLIKRNRKLFIWIIFNIILCWRVDISLKYTYNIIA